MDQLELDTEWERILALPQAVIYKHSPICGLSSSSLPEVRRFEATRPEVPLFMIDVITQRGLSQRIAEDLGLRHESPQVILLNEGSVAWHADHRGVSAEKLIEAVSA
jgi:bacillithiol system protein YtxJ